MKLKPKWIERQLHSTLEARPGKIVADAAIAHGAIGDGKLIPLVIVDTSNRPDIEEYVRVHQHLPPGDVKTQWGRLETTPESHIALILDFLRPAEVALILEFDAVVKGIVVDQILATGALYLQPGREGDRLSTTLHAPKVLIEVPDTGFKATWIATRLKYLAVEFRKRGLSRSASKEAARGVLDTLSEFGRVRFGNRRPGASD